MFFFPAFSFVSFFAFLLLSSKEVFFEATAVMLLLSATVAFSDEEEPSIFDLFPMGGGLPNSGFP